MNNLNLNINSKNSAVILIEFQKTWTEKGIFYNLIKNEYNSRNVLSNTIKLLEATRRKNIQVIQVPFIIDKSDKKNYTKYPLLPKLLKRFTRGTWKEELIPRILLLREGTLLMQQKGAILKKY